MTIYFMDVNEKGIIIIFVIINISNSKLHINSI